MDVEDPWSNGAAARSSEQHQFERSAGRTRPVSFAALAQLLDRLAPWCAWVTVDLQRSPPGSKQLGIGRRRLNGSGIKTFPKLRSEFDALGGR